MMGPPGRRDVVVGRDAELAVLAEGVERALGGAGGVLTIVGEAGIGKSALVTEGLQRLRRAAVVGRAAPGSVVAARALCDAAVAAVSAGADPAHPALRLSARPLDQLLGRRSAGGTAPSGAADGELDPHPLALADALLRLLALTPGRSVLVLEDLHWADADTVDALPLIADRVRGQRLLVIVTARPGESAATDDCLARLAREPHCRAIPLGPLDRSALAALVADLDGERARQIMARSAGIPLVVHQLVAADAPVLPPTIVESVAQRVDRLDAPGRLVLRAAALLGARFSADLLVRALDLPSGDVARTLAAAARMQLVDRDGFLHALIADAVLEGLFEPERSRLARRLLAAAGGDDHELAARLAEAAGDALTAADHHLAVASTALGAGSLRGARAAAVRVREVLGDGTGARAAALARQGSEVLVAVHAHAGEVSEALDEADAILSSADPDDQGGTVRLLLIVARALAAAERWDEAADRLAAAERLAPADAAALALAARIALGRGDLLGAERIAGSALAAAGDAAARCEAYEILGRIARVRDLDEAQAWFRRASWTAHQAGLPLWRARAQHELATITQLRDLTTQDLTAARGAAVEAAAPGLVASVDFHLAAMHGVLFEPEPARAAASRVLAAGRRLGNRRQQAWGWILLGQADAAAGDRRSAAAAGDEALALMPDDAEIRALATGTCRGLASLLAGDRDATLREWRQSVALLGPLPRTPLPPWYLWPLLAAVWTTDGPEALAETDSPGLRLSPGVDGLWHLAAAVLTARRGESSDSDLAAAAERFGRVPRFAGYAHLGYRLAAEAAMDDGWGEPVAWLAAAESWAYGAGLEGLVAQCRALARRAGAPQRRRGRGSTAVPPDLAARQVTSREADVLAQLARGRSNQDIADQLYLSPGTVKTHVESLLRKTGCRNRTELAALATAHGLG